MDSTYGITTIVTTMEPSSIVAFPTQRNVLYSEITIPSGAGGSFLLLGQSLSAANAQTTGFLLPIAAPVRIDGPASFHVLQVSGTTFSIKVYRALSQGYVGSSVPTP